MIKIDYDEPFSENVELAIKKLVANNKLISAESKLDSYSEMKNSENQITVLGGSLGIIIMLLGIHWGAILYDFQESIHAAILRVCPMADTNVWFHASLVG